MGEKKSAKIEIEILITNDCYDSVLNSVFTYIDRSYELFFMDTWKFSFNNEAFKQHSSLEECVSVDKKMTMSYLEKYHGVVFHRISKDDANLMASIEQELMNGRPVIAIVEVHWCHWYTDGYKKRHNKHAVIVTGISDGHVSLKDAQYAISGVEMTIEDFEKCLYFVDVLSLTDNVEIFDWHHEVRALAQRTLESSMFEDLLDFSEALSSPDALKNSIQNFKGSIYKAPLLGKINTIISSRGQLANVFKYISVHFKVIRLREFATEFEMMSKEWSAVFGMTCKVFLLPESKHKAIINKIAKRIAEIAEKEKKIAKGLYTLSKDSEVVVKADSMLIESNSYDITEFKQLDISGQVNSNAISSEIKYDCASVFTSESRYMYVPSKDLLGLKEVKGIPFSVESMMNKGNDHITCYGETISFEEDNYQQIYLLCNADLGDQCESIRVFYDDNTYDDVGFNVSSWSAQTVSEDDIALRCKVVARDTIRKQAFAYPFDSHVFIHRIRVNSKLKCRQFDLPLCPNIHVYAATLGK